MMVVVEVVVEVRAEMTLEAKINLILVLLECIGVEPLTGPGFF
jgi:hypothetical protein